MNPLLDFSGLPRFPDIRPEHVTPAVKQLLGECRETLSLLLEDDSIPTWRSFVEPLEDANERLSRAWGQVSHLNAVMNNPELREAYNANLPKITQYYAELSQNERLFARFRKIKTGTEWDSLSTSRKKIVENELRDFRLGGAELPDAQKARFMTIQERLALLSAKFEENLLDATNAWGHVVKDREALAGLPDDVVATARGAAKKIGVAGYKLTLHAPCYLPVMQYADNRSLREKMYRAYVTRASELGETMDWDNTPLIVEVLKLRREAARLLGFDNYAEVSIEPKMAETPAQVLDFLDELAHRAKPFAERDMRALRAFAKAEFGMTRLEAWDIAYASEKLREKQYAFSEQEVKQYFPEDIVLAGLFRLVEAIYGLNIRSTTVPVWHKDVKFFDILDRQGQLIGQFYLDLYARENKRGGAWMDDTITRRRKGDAIQHPVAYLTCNFSSPVGGKPALFTHDEVITLFHEFGHGLHHLLTAPAVGQKAPAPQCPDGKTRQMGGN